MSKPSFKNKPTDNIKLNQMVENMPPSGIRKFFNLTANMPDVISLSIGEPDFVTPWQIRETAIYSFEKGYTMYTANEGLIELRQEVSQHLATEYKVKYDPEKELLITVGTSEGLDLAFRAILNQGDEVIIPDPCYVAYPACVLLAGGVPVSVPTFEEYSFGLRAKEIATCITSKTKAILIGNPANPTGAVIPRDELEQMAELVKQHNLLVIYDEIYSKLIYDTVHTCLAALKDMKEHTILLNGFSKSHAMTGWRIGFTASNKIIIAAMTKIHQYTMLCAPITAQLAAIEALRKGDTEVKSMVVEYNQRRKFMVNGFRDMGLSCFEPKGAFYTFPCIKNTGLSSEEFATQLLHQEKVAVVPGNVFGKCGEGYIRCCYATSLKDIKEALNRIHRFLDNLHK